MATLEEEYKNYQQTNGTDQINQMYDAQKQAQLASLESAYNQNMSNAQAARDALPAQYQSRANDLAVQYERNRRNLNEQAAANGLNTGAGSQMQLALGSNYQRDYGGIRRAEQQAINDAERGIRDLQSAYQSSVQQAVANNDYQRAQALLAEYKNQYQRQLQQAQTLASYGDFSGYLNIPGYSQEQVGSMRSAWAASHPQLAYNTGAISASDYYRMTGKWPAGYQAPGSGGGWGGQGGSSGKLKTGEGDIPGLVGKITIPEPGAKDVESWSRTGSILPYVPDSVAGHAIGTMVTAPLQAVAAANAYNYLQDKVKSGEISAEKAQELWNSVG